MAQMVAEVSRLPQEYLFLGGADVIATVILFDFPRISP
jgi:hypothetical protein